jgi:hypothetical protein
VQFKDSARRGMKYIHIPEYYDRPQLAANVWRLTKGTHVAVCAFWTHPIGGEVRVEVDGELMNSEAHRDGVVLFELSEQWRTQFQQKGWSSDGSSTK